VGLKCTLGPVNIMVKGGTRVSFDFEGASEKDIQNLLSQLKGRPLKIEVKVDDGEEKNQQKMISQPQLNLIYQLLKDIALGINGEVTDTGIKEIKQEAQQRLHYEDFSLSKGYCSKEQATQMINVLIGMVLEFDVQTKVNVLKFMAEQPEETIESYARYMLSIKKCTLCGRPGEIHHWDAIGMGRNRKTVDDSPLRQICLCREHHVEAETIGKDGFKNKYHIWGVYVV